MTTGDAPVASHSPFLVLFLSLPSPCPFFLSFTVPFTHSFSLSLLLPMSFSNHFVNIVNFLIFRLWLLSR